VQATPSSPVAAAIMPLPEKMRRGRRYHPVATRRRRYFLLAASVFGLNQSDFARLLLNILFQPVCITWLPPNKITFGAGG
jgi:hypothetical protein